MKSVLARIVDEAAAKLVQTGQIKHGYEQLPFEKRWPAVSEAANGHGGMHWERDVYTRELYELATHPTIIHALKPLLGENIILTEFSEKSPILYRWRDESLTSLFKLSLPLTIAKYQIMLYNKQREHMFPCR